MVLILPENAEIFKDNWTENVPNLFNDLNSVKPGKLNRSTTAGQFVSARLVVKDQIDDEIYFPTIKQKNDVNGEIDEKVAAFRESVNIPDGFSVVESNDFTKAKDRLCFTVSANDLTTLWATEAWEKISGISAPAHNEDKNELTSSDKIIVKIYNGESLKVLNTYQFRGIYYPSDENDSQNEKGLGVLHVIDVTSADILPIDENSHEDSGSFEETVSLLEQLLLGDRLAARLLLSALISRVYLRREELVLGGVALNLNFKGLDPLVPEMVTRILHELVESVKRIPIEIKNLNSKPFIPVKDYEQEELIHAELSLNSNTLLLLDETKIEAGGLTQIGTGNIGAISELIEKRTIKFDYQFYQKDFEADITCISLTFGKSLLSNDHTIKIESKFSISNLEEYYSGLIEAANESGLFSRVRRYINFCKQMNYKVSDEEMMQNFIVETRKADEKIGIPQLHNILILGRSFAIARGQDSAQLQYLEEAREILKKINDRAF